MSLPVINENVAADDPTAVTGSVRLWAQDGGGGIAYTNAGTPITLGAVTRVSFDASGNLKADDGLTSLTLNPNSGASADAVATPTGTVWQYEIRFPGVRDPSVRYLTVPDVAGPLQVLNILTDQPGAIAPAGSQAYTDAAVATRVLRAGDTMTGGLVLASSVTNALLIPDVGGTYNALTFRGGAPDVNNPMVLIRGSSTSVGTYSIWQIRDAGNAPIAWVLNAGGLAVNDQLRMVDDSGTYQNAIGFQYLNESSRKGFALVFGHAGTTGSTFVDGGITYNRDAFKLNYVRLNDSSQLVHSAPISVGVDGTLVPILITPTAGPSSEPGFSIGISTPARFWRSGNAAWSSDSAWTFTGAVTLSAALTAAATAAGVPGIAATSNLTTGPRWDATLGLVQVVGGTDRWRVGTSGNQVPSADNTYDLGATTAYVKVAYAHTLNTGNATHAEVSATPEGSVTAAVGSTRVDSTNGVFYLKASGAGNTGWTVIQTAALTSAANSIRANATSSTAPPADLALGASTIAARLATGNIVAATPAQILTLMGMQSFASPAAVGSYSAPGGNTTTGAVTTNTEYAHPILFTQVPGAASKLAININATVATSVLRVGVRNDAGLSYPYPGTLINECSATFSGSAGTGTVEQTITWTPLPNVLYWLSAVSQTAAANVTKTNAVPYSLLSSSAGLSSIVGGYTQAGITGALSTFSASLAATANPIRIAVLF